MRNFFNNLGNIFIKPLLRSPFHGLVSKRIMLVTFTGHKSGKRYSTPVEYMQNGNTVTLFTRKDRRWWKNLQNAAPITLRIRGQDVSSTAELTLDNDTKIAETFRQMYSRMSEDQIKTLTPTLVMAQFRI